MKKPLKEVLVDPVDEQLVQEIWRRIESAPPRDRRTSTLALSAAAALLTIVWVNSVWRSRPSFEAVPPPGALGALAEVTHFSDGSRVAVFSGLVSLVRASGDAVELQLEQGRAHFAVQPGGPRRWTIRCKDVRVEVLGTRFELDQNSERLRVTVEEGRVGVFGPSDADRHLVVGAGENVDVPRPTPSETSSRPSAVAPGAKPTHAAPAPALRGSSRRVLTATASVQRPSPSPVVREPWVSIPPTPSRSDQLLRIAEDSEREGSFGAAVEALAELLALAPDHPRAGHAAFIKGRIELMHLQRPRDAAASLRRATSLAQLPPEQAEECAASLAEAYLKSYELSAARAAAEDYLARYPRGVRRQSMRAIVEMAP